MEANNIKDLISNYYKSDISSKKRDRYLCYARFIFYDLARHYNRTMTYQKIAKVVNRDHSTVCYGINQLPNILKQDKLLQLDYLNLSSLCETKYKKENKMGRNPYENFLTKEDLLQRSVMQYIKLKYPNVFAIHVPNEGKRSPFERFKFKILGGVSGVPEILIFEPNKDFSGLAIELKVGYNKPTENQKVCLKRLKNANWDTYWLNTYDETIKIIDNYLFLSNTQIK